MSNKTPIRVDASFTPSGTQDVNIVSSITLAISAASLPLPTGAATESTLLAAKIDLDKFTFASTRLLVDGSGVIQPISGSISVSNFPASQTVTQGTSPWVVSGTVAATQSGTWNINNISGTISLPTGAATEATLSALNGKVTVVNTGAVTISSPLPSGTNVIGHVITDTGSTTAVSNFPATQPVSGTVAVTQLTSPWVVSGTVTANAGTNLNTSLLALDSTLTNATQKTKIVDTAGTNVASISAAGAVKVDGSAVTQPISGTVSISGTVPVSGTITANQGTSPWVSNITQFGSSNVVTGIGTSGVGIPRVTISNDSSLAANQSVNINQVGGSALTEGQKTMANSLPVVVASDQTAIPTTKALGTTATVTRVAVSTTVATLQASNPNRKQLVIYNEGGTLRVKLGSGATLTDYSYEITVNGTLELDTYSGLVTGIKVSGNTFAQVTEII